MLIRAGERVAQEQKRLAATSPDGSHGRPSGYMRSRVGFELNRIDRDLCVDVGTDATTPDGHSYPLDVELGTRPHVIESKGDYPLRDDKGHVFGRRVQHPGTTAQPFLRPSLDVLRGGI